jgi:hypothetical protein
VLSRKPGLISKRTVAAILTGGKSIIVVDDGLEASALAQAIGDNRKFLEGRRIPT